MTSGVKKEKKTYKLIVYTPLSAKRVTPTSGYRGYWKRALENVNLTAETLLKTRPTRTTPNGIQFG